MPEELFIKLLQWMNYGYSLNHFDKDGYYIGWRGKRIVWNFPWSRNNKYFDKKEKIILKEFCKRIKVNDKDVFQNSFNIPFNKEKKQIKIAFPLYKDLENFLILYYETLTRKKFDRTKIQTLLIK